MICIIFYIITILVGEKGGDINFYLSFMTMAIIIYYYFILSASDSFNCCKKYRKSFGAKSVLHTFILDCVWLSLFIRFTFISDVHVTCLPCIWRKFHLIIYIGHHKLGHSHDHEFLTSDNLIFTFFYILYKKKVFESWKFSNSGFWRIYTRLDVLNAISLFLQNVCLSVWH